MDKNNEKSSVKHISDIIGEWGRWQRRYFTFMFILDITGALNNMGYTFYAFKVDFWCDDVPQDYVNKTEAMKCFKFNNLNEKCTKWRYDDTMFISTIISEFDLVCDRSVWASFTQTCYMLGYVIGGTVFAHFTDKYGRRPIAWIGMIIEIFAVISSASSVNIIQFTISRFIQGTASLTKFMALNTISIEIMGPKHRSDISLIIGLGWVLGYISLPAFAILIRHFRYMQLITYIPSILMMIWWYFLFESPRWCITHNQIDRAEEILRKALKVNGKSDAELHENMIQLKENIDSAILDNGKNRNLNVFHLLKTPNLRKYTLIVWYSVPVYAFIYYGISYNIGSYGGNYFVNFILSGLVEAPSQLICLIGLRYYGRKTLAIIFVCITAVSSLAMIPNVSVSRVIFALIGKFGINSIWWIISLLKSEFYPTVLRSTGNGAAAVVARIGAVTAPFISELSEVTGVSAVMIFYFVLLLINGILILGLPETKGKELPDTLQQSENYEKIPMKDVNKNTDEPKKLNAIN